MHRIQVQLTPEQVRILREMAQLRGSSISALVREGVDLITATEAKRRRERTEKALAFVGMFGDEPDVAERHDDYLAEIYAETGDDD